MSKSGNRIAGVAIFAFLLCGLWFAVSRAAQGNEQGPRISPIGRALDQTVQKQEKTIADLKAELETLRKTVAANAQAALDRDNKLKGWVDSQGEKFNTQEERFKRVFDKLASQERVLGTQNQGLTSHKRRLAAIEQFLRRRP